MSVAIVSGSSRSDGNTRKLVNVISSHLDINNIYDLSDYTIGYFDYDFQNQHDDFIRLIKELLTFDELIIVSPVYWYTISGQLKTFFDRFTDLINLHKDLGRQLRGKKLSFISCGYDKKMHKSLDTPIRLTCGYLGIEYKGHFYSSIRNEEISEAGEQKIKKSIDKLMQVIPLPYL
ncbi:NAD(P)H-dependent oxidoreductase [Pedobacter sp. PAMC26386]|nr:NAD(P)H-dependent oxidoreductase [Pedobacter sp. PAMC26386]